MNIVDKNGETALHYTAHGGNADVTSRRLEIAKLLIEGAANKYILNKYGETALDLANQKCSYWNGSNSIEWFPEKCVYFLDNQQLVDLLSDGMDNDLTTENQQDAVESPPSENGEF